MSKGLLGSILYIVLGNFLLGACHIQAGPLMKNIVTNVPLSLCDFLMQEPSHDLIQGTYDKDDIPEEIINLYQIKRTAIQRYKAAYPNNTWLLNWTVQDENLGLINYSSQMTNGTLDSIEVTVNPFINLAYDEVTGCLGLPDQSNATLYSLEHVVPADLITFFYNEKLQVIRLIRPQDSSSLIETKMYSISVYID